MSSDDILGASGGAQCRKLRETKRQPSVSGSHPRSLIAVGVRTVAVTLNLNENARARAHEAIRRFAEFI